MADTESACGFRRQLWICGNRGWCRQQAINAISAHPSAAVAWCGESPPGAHVTPITIGTFRSWLGGEFDLLIIDAFSGFDPDAYGGLAGTIRRGGYLVLLSPTPERWPQFADPFRGRLTADQDSPDRISGRFLARFAQLALDSPATRMYRQDSVDSPPLELVWTGQTTPREADVVASISERVVNQEQRDAVFAVLGGAGRRRKPVVLIADRGRGKSTVLGIAASALLDRGQRVFVTAPSRIAVHAVFKQTAGTPGRQAVAENASALTFRAPDRLLNTAPEQVDFLLIDEAAALPLALLLSLCERFSRCAIATTTHGYEGSGRGFALRFIPRLREISRNVKTIHLREPARWPIDDPLERLTFASLLLDAEPAQCPTLHTADQHNCRYERLDLQELARDEFRLRTVFGLLLQAHYRTRPSDLRALLDNPALSCHGLFFGNIPIAVALIAHEGGLDPALSKAIVAGHRRPRGHLLCESLALHLGLCEAPQQNAARIVRIAVHPSLQRRQLGSKLLYAIRHDSALKCDFLGSSFAYRPELLDFWRKSHYQLVRIGVKSNAASDAPSVLVLRPISAAGERLSATAQERFRNQIWHQFSDPDGLGRLAPTLVATLFRAFPIDETGTRDARTIDQVALRGYAAANRPLSSVADEVYRFCQAGLVDPILRSRLTNQQCLLITARIIQHRSGSDTAALTGLTGSRAVDCELRRAMRALLNESGEFEKPTPPN